MDSENSIIGVQRTKIIVTVGPAMRDYEVMKQVFLAGANVARFNMSHGTHEEHAAIMKQVRQISDDINKSIGVLLDTRGPEVRVGKFENGKCDVVEGEEFVFTTTECVGTSKIAFVNYSELHSDMTPGQVIMVDDGLLRFEVLRVEGTNIITHCVRGGVISNQKAMNFPAKVLSFPFISEGDRADLIFGCEQQVDFVAASFVSTADNVREVRALLKEHGGGDIDIISKIENQGGVDNLDEILEAGDGIMVARGDLGVELPFCQLPGLQKMMITQARHKCRRVIVATEMLESMIEKPRPTRAEVSDVANAICDGASGILLAGETASGKHPVECVQAMAAIARDAEIHMHYAERMRNFKWKIRNISDATAHAAAMTAHDLNAKMIVVFTKCGETARMVSRFRPEIPVVAAVHDCRGYKRLSIAWGISPILSLEARKLRTHDLWEYAEKIARKCGCVDGDTVVITAGSPVIGPTNTMKTIIVGRQLDHGD